MDEVETTVARSPWARTASRRGSSASPLSELLTILPDPREVIVWHVRRWIHDLGNVHLVKGKC